MASETSDGFGWAPIVRLENVSGKTEGIEWNAAMDFAGPDSESTGKLVQWQRLAQVLLISNEMAFVD
jgi:hypothetical protein